MRNAAVFAGFYALVLSTLAAPLPTAQDWTKDAASWTDANGNNLWTGEKTGTTQPANTQPLVQENTDPNNDPNTQPTNDPNSQNWGTITVMNSCSFPVGMRVSSGASAQNYDAQTLSSGGSYAPATYDDHFGGPLNALSDGQSLKFWPDSEGEQTDPNGGGNELQMEYTVFQDSEGYKVNYDVSQINGPTNKISWGFSGGSSGTVYTTSDNGIPVTSAASSSYTFTLCGSH